MDSNGPPIPGIVNCGAYSATSTGKVSHVSGKPGWSSMKESTCSGGVVTEIGVLSASATQSCCIAVHANLSPQLCAVSPFGGSGKLQRLQIDSSGIVGPKPGSRLDASTTRSQYSSVITGGVNSHSITISRATINGLPCGRTTSSISSTTFLSP